MKVSHALMLGVFLSTSAGVVHGQSLEKMLFVTNRDSGTVSGLRVNYDGTLTLIATYPSGSKPQDCAVTADGKHLLIIHSDPNTNDPELLTVLKINPNGTMAGPVITSHVADSPMAIGVSPSGFALAPSVATELLASLRLDPGAVVPVSTAPAGPFPFRPVASQDSRFVYCAGSISPDNLVTFSLTSGGQLTRLDSINFPSAEAFGIALHPSGNLLYVSTGQANTIRWYNVNQATGALTFGGSVNPGGNSVTELAVTPNGKWLLSVHVLSDTINVTRINANGSLTPTGFSYFITADARDVVTDGRFVYATDETLIGGSVGIHAFAINNDFGFLTSLGQPYATGGFKPQFMSLWVPPVCYGDADRNGVVEFRDITFVLTNWGLAGPDGDANQDGQVNFDDITTILSNFGTCVYR